MKKQHVKGAPKKLPPKIMKNVLKTTRALQKQANAHKEVTADMITDQAGVDVCDRTLQRAFREAGIKFYNLKEKPILTKEDVKTRFLWVKAHKKRTKEGWVSKPHGIIDNKHFQMFTNEGGRDFAARRSVRGAYQIQGEAPQPWLVKPKGGTVRFPAQGVTVTAAVIKGKIRMWHYVPDKWNGANAAAMYKGPLAKAFAKAYPEHAVKPNATWSLIEDNDPAGYKSSKGMAAKASARIVTDSLPRRSPDLNVLDYALWHAINAKMRLQERSFPKGKKETKDAFKARLRKTALGLPQSLVKKCVCDMRRRCQLIAKAKGGLIKE